MKWPLTKTFIERIEKEFRTNKLKNKHLYYDMNIRVDDPEEFRSFALELITDSDFTASVSKLTRFEDTELEGTFQGGRLKPIRAIIKGVKEITKGTRFPYTWKALLSLGALSIIIGWKIKPEISRFLYPLGIFLGILSAMFYMIKEKIRLALWFKLAGIYNVQDNKADVKVVLAGDCSKHDTEAFEQLEDNISEIHNEISRKYIKRKTEPKIVIKAKETAETKIVKKMREVNERIEELEKKFLAKGVSEETYKKIRANLDEKKERLGTLLDIVSM